MSTLVIRNGLVVTGDGAVDADLAVEDEQIVAIGRNLRGEHSIDAAGCYVLPGAIDNHVHLQMAMSGLVSTDSFRSGTIAAGCGGTTTVIDFVAPEAEQPLLHALQQRRAEADGRVAVDYGLHMTIPAWHAATTERLQEVPEVVAAGLPTFKMYQAYGGVMLDDTSLLRALTAVADAGGRTVLHSETGPILDMLRASALAEGHNEPIWHAYTRPAPLEATAVQRAVELADLAGCPLFIFHVGCEETVQAIAAACGRGLDVWGETCPQYLLLNAEQHLGDGDGARYICAPPLRGLEDQDVLWQALAGDTLQVVSTDHCPWTLAEKARPDFAQVPGGVPGIEARLALVYHFGVNTGILSLERWVHVCSTNPARWMGLTRKGRLAPGFDADIVIFDPDAEKTISPAMLHETAGWTPYNGMEVIGWPRTVLLRGKVIVENEQYVGTPGDGRFVERSTHYLTRPCLHVD
jgi:dihydropyrimidinase